MLHVLAVDGGGAEEHDAPHRPRRKRSADVQHDREVLLEDLRRVAELFLDRRADDEDGVGVEKLFEDIRRIGPSQIERRRRPADERDGGRGGLKRSRQTAADVSRLSEEHDAAERRHQRRVQTHNANR